MKKLTLTLLSLSMTALTIGCKGGSTTTVGSNGAGAGGVAVVDLDKVAKAMGWNEDMNKNLEETKAKVADQFRDFLKPAQHAAETKRDEIAKSLGLSDARKDELTNAKTKEDLKKLGLTDKQMEELGQALGLFANEAQGANQRLNQILEAQKNAIVQKYVEAVKPAVRRVALASNRSVVMMPSGTLLYNDASSDITDQVVDDLQHSSIGAVPLPPIPTLKFDAPAAAPAASSTAAPSPAPAVTPAPTPAPAVTPTRPKTTRPATPSTPD